MGVGLEVKEELYLINEFDLLDVIKFDFPERVNQAPMSFLIRVWMILDFLHCKLLKF